MFVRVKANSERQYFFVKDFKEEMQKYIKEDEIKAGVDNECKR